MITVLLVCLLSLLLLTVSWISREREAYTALLLYQKELESYGKQCLEPEHPRETIEHRVCDLGSVLFHGKCSWCQSGTFALPQWTYCVKFLTCDDLATDIRPTGFVWQTERWRYISAEWNSFRVVYSQETHNVATDNSVVSSVEAAWEVATVLAPHQNILYPVGWCSDTSTLVYGLREDVYPLTQLDTLLERTGCDNLFVRFKLVTQYVSLLHHLHQHPSGPYTLCDSHTLHTLLSQFALSRHFNLLLANFDNLPGGHDPVVCSQRELRGDFPAPEQTWPYGRYRVFNPAEQPGYSHASDIWKVPDVTKWLLGASRESRSVLNYLATINHRCKSMDYTLRPSAKEILNEYETIWNAL